MGLIILRGNEMFVLRLDMYIIIGYKIINGCCGYRVFQVEQRRESTIRF